MGVSRKPRFTIDHIEMYVPDRRQAASWYGKVLGCDPYGHHREVTTYEVEPVRAARRSTT